MPIAPASNPELFIGREEPAILPAIHTAASLNRKNLANTIHPKRQLNSHQSIIKDTEITLYDLMILLLLGVVIII